MNRLILDSYDIHLWLTYPDDIDDPALLSAYQALLNEEERERQQRFRFQRLRHQYLITRALVRTTLSRYAPIAAPHWHFDKNDYGRPEIANSEPLPPLRFNLSHADGMIICGVVLQRDIGVDVEDSQRQARTIEIADRFFSAQECHDLRQLPVAQQPDRFFDYWTLKESYIKARGMGLALPLGQFSFHFPGNDSNNTPVTISFGEKIQDDAQRWTFWLMRATQRHRMAVCVDTGADPGFQLQIRKVVPLQSEEIISVLSAPSP